MPKADAVFEGGGVKGIGLVGALEVAEARGYEWVNVAGTSAGAIVGALVAAGYSAAEMKAIMTSIDYSRFKDRGLLDAIPLVGPLLSVGVEKGIFEGEFFEQWLRELLAAKGARTFGQLVIPEYKDNHRFRYKLRVIASDISMGRLLILPQDIQQYGEDPDELDIARAVRMSMSIPFFFEPVKLKNRATNETSYIVDGGILSNYPVWLFDEGDEPGWPTFGFKLVEPDESRPGVKHRITGPLTLFGAIFSTLMEAHDARYITDQNFARTIPIPTGTVRATDFDLSGAQAEALYEAGRQAAQRFFEHWNFEKYKEEYRKGKQSMTRQGRLMPVT